MLYFFAASQYPGGTYFNGASPGYSHVSNYWCDLLEAVSYGGHFNRGQPYAILATVILPLSLVSFWLQVTVLFRDSTVPMWIVPVAGTVSMILATLVFTRLHNFVINASFVFGSLAFGITTLCLARSRYNLLFGLAVAALGLAAIDFCMWQTRILVQATPMVQKTAYASFFVWVIATSRQIRKTIH